MHLFGRGLALPCLLISLGPIHILISYAVVFGVG